jgi:hypothetical protein
MEDVGSALLVIFVVVGLFLFGFAVGAADVKEDHSRAACVEKCGTRQPVLENGLCGCVEAP